MKNILSSLTTPEKNRILEMHKTASRKNYLSEQKDNVQDLPEVTISAWMPFESAKREASKKGGNILLYIYNDGCDACDGYTNNIMSNPDLKQRIKKNNLTLSKMIMCVPEGEEETPFKSMGKEGKFAPCDESERNTWLTFENKFDVYGVPALMIIDSSGSNLLSRVEYGIDPVKIFDRLFDQLAEK